MVCYKNPTCKEQFAKTPQLSPAIFSDLGWNAQECGEKQAETLPARPSSIPRVFNPPANPPPGEHSKYSQCERDGQGLHGGLMPSGVCNI